MTDPFAAQRLDGKGVVTGGTQGLGAAIAARAEQLGAAPEDIAPMVTYLLSDAAWMVTGSVVDYDQTVHGPYGDHVTAA
jgi:hypothetical protein